MPAEVDAGELLVLRLGEARYEPVMAALRADEPLLAYLREAAGFELTEDADTVWIVATDDAGRVLAACAYEPADEDGIEVKCVDSWERPSSWDDDLYALVYAARHELIRWHDAVTYIYLDIVELHEWDGWVVVGSGVDPRTGIRWYRLWRPADLRA